MTIQHVPTFDANDRRHRLSLATAVNELIKVRPPNDRTAAEVAAGVIPVDHGYPELLLERYGGGPDKSAAENDGALERAVLAAQEYDGGTIIFPRGQCQFASSHTIPALVNIRGAAAGRSFAKSSLGLTTVGSELHFTGSNGLHFDEGYNTIEDILVTGVSGDYWGVKVSGSTEEVNSRNLSVRGFTSGAGLWLENVFSFGHDNLDIQGCGVGLYFSTVVNAAQFRNLLIQNCTVGWLTGSGTYHTIDMQGTIQGCELGKKSTSFPSTNLLTVSAQVLSDLGVTQANLEGGYIVFGVDGNIRLYCESCSLVLAYIGLNSVVDLSGSYFNDQVTLLGTNQVAPRNMIRGARARALLARNIVVSTDNARGNALFDINSDRFHDFAGGHWRHSDGTTYTGAVYEDTINGSVSYLSTANLTNAAALLQGHSAQAYRCPARIVTSSGGTLTIDAATGSVFFTTLTENVTVDIDNPTDGQYIEIHFIQDATGGRTVTWPTAVRHSWSDTSNTANNKTCVAFRYRSSDSRWHQIGQQVTYHS